MKKWALIVFTILISTSIVFAQDTLGGFGPENRTIQEDYEMIVAVGDIKETASSGPLQFSFKGSPTSEELIKTTGIFVTADKQKSLIAINNTWAGYKMILPYSENWNFDLDKGHLKGNADLINFDVQIWPGSESPEQHLAKIKDYLSSSSNPIPANKIEYVTDGKEKVLRSEVNAEKVNPSFKGVKQVNYYNVKKRGETLYKLHLSVVVPADKQRTMDEKMFLNYMTLGFSIDPEK